MADLDLELEIARARKRRRDQLNKEMSLTPDHPRMEEADARGKFFDFMTYGVPQGLAMGGADEIGSFITGQPVEDVRAKFAAAQQRSPTAVQAGEVMGGGLGAALPMGLGMKAMQGTGLGRQMVAGGAIGAGLGALQNFNEGEGGLGPRVQNIGDNLRSVAVGGGVGAAAPGIARILAKMVPGRHASPSLVNQGVARPAAKRIARAFDDDARLAGDVQQYLDNLGPDGMIADIGPNSRRAAGAMVSLPGEQSARTYRAIENRALQAPDRINQDLDAVMGQRMNMPQAQEAMRGAQSADAQQAYDAFNQTQVPLTPELRAVLQRADDVGAFGYARQVAAARGTNINPADYLDPNATHISGEALDLLSRAVRDRSKQAWRNGEGALGEALGGINDNILDTVPQLRNIRRTYADQMSIREAAESGSDILNNRISADRFAADWANMSPQEQAAFRVSARDALEQKMSGAVNEAAAGRNALGTRTVQAKIRTAFGDDAVRALAQRVDAEKTFIRTRSDATQGSETAARQAAQREYSGLVDEAGNRMGPVRRVRQFAGDMSNRAVDSLTGSRPDVVMNDVSRVLTAQGAERDRMVQALIGDAMRRQTRQAGSARLEAIVRQLLGASSLPAAGQAN